MDTQGATQQTGSVICLDAYRNRLPSSRDDAALDLEWDVLRVTVEHAWTWRDPESVAALAACVLRLQARVLDDWGYGPDKLARDFPSADRPVAAPGAKTLLLAFERRPAPDEAGRPTPAEGRTPRRAPPRAADPSL